MKKIILSAFLIASVVACNQPKAQNNGEASTDNVVSAEGAPKMKFDNDVYDFGKIKQGEKVIYDFTFTNTGKTPLIISNAVATCGCTVPEIPKEPIAAGAKGKINVVFNSTGKNGLQDKVVTITANTIPAETKIHLIGEIVK